jgi:hypothetical protein
MGFLRDIGGRVSVMRTPERYADKVSWFGDSWPWVEPDSSFRADEGRQWLNWRNADESKLASKLNDRHPEW